MMASFHSAESSIQGRVKGKLVLFESMHYCSCIVKFHTSNDGSAHVGLGRGRLHCSYEGLNCKSILIIYVYIWRNNIINSICMFQFFASSEIFHLFFLHLTHRLQ